MARSIKQCGHHVTCALIGTSRKLAAYKYASSLALEQRLSTSWWIQTEESKRNAIDTYTVTVKKGGTIIEHLIRKVSHCSFFLRWPSLSCR